MDLGIIVHRQVLRSEISIVVFTLFSFHSFMVIHTCLDILFTSLLSVIEIIACFLDVIHLSLLIH